MELVALSCGCLQGGDFMFYDECKNCFNCSHLWWDNNCHCWECLIDGHELSTDYEAEEELWNKSCDNFEE